MEKILVTGAFGQIGSEMVPELRKKYGKENVVAVGHSKQPDDETKNSGPFAFVDVCKKEELEKIVDEYKIDTIYHLAAILSAVGEKNPALAYKVNNTGFYNILEIAKDKKLERVMIPSSIAVFGSETPKDNTPNETVLNPSTMYGISKVHGELLGEYYFNKFGVDVRGVRYPGIISNKTLPGGGTTDYAVEIFYYAVKNKKYTCFLNEESTLPMMYMPDALKAMIELAEADVSKLTHHCNYNVAGMSFSPKELEAEIKKLVPEFSVEYNPDYRQKIADSWPKSIDDSIARRDWNWKPDYSLEEMTKDMLDVLRKKAFEI